MELSCGSTSEHDVDEASYDQHECRYYDEYPKEPEPITILIAERRGHRGPSRNEHAVLFSANGLPLL
jgi:hypothetical protein